MVVPPQREESSPERRARLRAELAASGKKLTPEQRAADDAKRADSVAQRKAADDAKTAERNKSASAANERFIKKNKITGPPTKHRTF